MFFNTTTRYLFLFLHLLVDTDLRPKEGGKYVAKCKMVPLQSSIFRKTPTRNMFNFTHSDKLSPIFQMMNKNKPPYIWVNTAYAEHNSCGTFTVIPSTFSICEC
jgi:hypothetical protein